MRSESEIVHQVKRLKYQMQRHGCGFHLLLKYPDAVGNPLDMLTYSMAAAQLEWVLGYKVEVKEINWYQAAKKARRRCG